MGEIQKLLNTAKAELNYLEKQSNAQLDDKTANAGSNNYTKYWRDIEPSFQAQAWCLCFAVWCFVQTFGLAETKKRLFMKDLTFYTPTAAQYFKDNGQWFKQPKIGDLIFFKNSQRIHHVGIVYKVSSTTVYTYEGNTSSGSAVIPNGGGVCAKQYVLNNSSIAGYGRPKYNDTTEANFEIVDETVTSDRRGLKILADSLNVRKTPGNGEVVKTLKKGQRVNITAKAKYEDGSYWFKTADGYISGKYVEGWIKEGNGLWWYILKDYTYPLNCIYTIDGQDYVFDKKGWMITSDRISSSGVLKNI